MEQHAYYDQASAAALEDILHFFSTAGYLHVLHPTTSSFDKVVGGLCWGVLASGATADVPHFFDENASIGERISLAEAVVRALRNMQCPYALQAHQIHGGDYPALRPVVAWLVKAVAARRRLAGRRFRSSAHGRFGLGFGRVAVGEAEEVVKGGSGFHRSLRTRYAAERKLRLRWEEEGVRAEVEEEEMAVRACLLEFGEKFADSDNLFGFSGEVAGEERVGEVDGGEFDQQYLAMEAQAKEEAEEKQKQLKQIEDKLLKYAQEEDGGIDKKRAKQIVQLERHDIQRAAKRHDEEVSKLDQIELGMDGKSPLFEQLSARKQHQREVEALNAKINGAKKPLRRLKELQQKMNAEVASVERLVRSMDAAKKKLLTKIEALTQREMHVDDRDLLNQLTSLVEENTSVKRRVKEFKSKCKKELKELQAEVKEVKLAPEVTREMKKVRGAHQVLTERFQAARRVAAENNKEISSLLRKIDEVPSRSELVQFERRFLELYEQVASKLDETKRHVNTFNTLKREFELMEKEESLLGSVNETFASAMNSKRGRIEFLEQFDKVVRGLRVNLEQATKQKDQAAQDKNKIMKEHQELIEKQRNYFTAVSELQKECDINEKLVAAAEKAQ